MDYAVASLIKSNTMKEVGFLVILLLFQVLMGTFACCVKIFLARVGLETQSIAEDRP